MLRSPLPNAPADAQALEFAWDDATARRLQVSASPSFDALVADVPVQGLNVLSLQGLVPANQGTYYWRVGDDGAWSDAAPFRAASDDDVFAWNQARAREAHDAQLDAMRQAYASPFSDVAEAGLSATTSKNEALAFVYFLVGSFAILLVIVFRAVA
ncbi:MAG: hypothetical protein IAE99_09680 [Rhodothermales bacterium]|nr:hypothetical protein [Rhodothermales bacterium]